MSTHAHFEELCVLATSGQLAPAESDELNHHLLECENCRTFLKDADFISTRVIGHALRIPRETTVPAGIRERFLARAVREGLKMDAGAPAPDRSLQAEAHPPVKTASLRSPHHWIAQLHPWQAWASALLAGAACFALGAWIKLPLMEAWHAALRAPAEQAAVQRLAPVLVLVNKDSGRIQALTVETNQLANQIAALTLQLAEAKQDKEETEENLQQKLTTVQSSASQDHESMTHRSEVLNAQVSDLQSRLEAVRQQQLLAESDLKTARLKTAEYSTRLELLQTQQRSQEAPTLPSSTEISSLVAARNLHIIDVYDSNAAGKRQRAFGRAFLVEGKSLVFYAYDLNTVHAQKNITFHLWGEKAGIKETTLSLGILHDDDPNERRWAFTCDDPNVLAKINTVYVTAEPSGRPADSPKGPKVLYAYFGAPPNHP